MQTSKLKIIGISGSLRATSSATAVLQLAGTMFPPNITFSIYDGLEQIPAFNDSNKVPETVQYFIDIVTEADAVLFCIPEYAFGMPGALKNALDWAVSSVAFSDKPVGLITAALGGEKAHASFLMVLTALGTRRSEAACLLLPFIRSKMNEKHELTDKAALQSLKNTVDGVLELASSKN